MGKTKNSEPAHFSCCSTSGCCRHRRSHQCCIQADDLLCHLCGHEDLWANHGGATVKAQTQLTNSDLDERQQKVGSIDRGISVAHGHGGATTRAHVDKHDARSGFGQSTMEGWFRWRGSSG
ncbi:hypothetical protein NL676_029322 [Syzygium grande]|nr:hypothetical protein NL676_029322 [Syzygium grande]